MRKSIFISFLTVFIYAGVSAQPSLSFDLKKPPKFENRALGSEKSANKKFTVPRRIFQNTITHYNYYFNANNRLNEIIARAKSSTKDDYSQLLPFYNYTLQGTAAFKSDLDSVIYKSTTGVLIHDLRNDWIDNMYLLIGKAYYLRNEPDSAYLTFQYLNYTFSPKEKDGYDKVIGSNQDEGSNAFSISTRENTNIAKKVFSRPPSRNESFIWQIKTYLAKDELAEAGGLIETLKNDPQFPDRLTTALEEVQAYLFYKQQLYDSAALHLEKSLGNAADKQEQARWEYLIAQLYERAGKTEQAEKYYNIAIRHALDPVLEVYARLNAIRQNKGGSEKDIQHAIDQLVKMARKDRYLLYRDIIYYTAANIELDRNHPEGAKLLLLKSIQTSLDNPVQKSKSYLALGDLAFGQKEYTAAKSFYDSLFIQSVSPEDAKMVTARKEALQKLVLQTTIIERQDSLQRIAAMPVAERDAFIRKLVKQLRKQYGVTDESETGPGANLITKNNDGPGDLFESNSGKGDWYFYNSSLKGKGYSEFIVKWGTRPNVDNWRRQASVVQNAGNLPQGAQQANTATDTSAKVSFSYLLGNLPLTPEKLQASNEAVDHALFAAGKAYMNGLEDYTSAIIVLERMLAAFPASVHTEEALFNLYYCYRKAGLPSGQAQVKQALAAKFPKSSFLSLLNHPDPARSPDSVLKATATRQYDKIYNLFIEGKFSEALQQKKLADSIYGKKYWTPQLLYITAVYHIRQREDSTAKEVLRNMVQNYPSTPMGKKAANLIAVLNRRREIEDYLTKLNLEKPVPESVAVISPPPPVKKQVVNNPPKQVPDTTTAAAPRDAKSVAVKGGKLPVNKPGISIKAPERKTADSLQLVKQNVAPPVENQEAADTTVKAPVAAVKQTDQPVAKPKTAEIPVSGLKAADTVQLARKPMITIDGYSNNVAEAQYVLLVMDKVDPVYVAEAKNAFNRYHRERYSKENIEATSLSLNDDVKLILFKNFQNAAMALDYIDKTRKLASVEIIPWLTAQKYAFLIISESNLEALKNKKDLTTYRKFLTATYPGRF